jgi:hypothetical protein
MVLFPYPIVFLGASAHTVVYASTTGTIGLDSFQMMLTNYGFHTLPEKTCAFEYTFGDSISRIMECVVSNCSNLTRSREYYGEGNLRFDFIGPRPRYGFIGPILDSLIKFELKTFTASGTGFENTIAYCHDKIFILASIKHFPFVRFRVISGETLLRLFPSGLIPVSFHHAIFVQCLPWNQIFIRPKVGLCRNFEFTTRDNANVAVRTSKRVGHSVGELTFGEDIQSLTESQFAFVRTTKNSFLELLRNTGGVLPCFAPRTSEQWTMSNSQIHVCLLGLGLEEYAIEMS